MMVDEHRLDRIEQKLDKLTEAVSQIARVEEQLLSVFKRMDRHEKRLDDQEDDIKELTESLIINSKSVRMTERLFWGIISISLSTLVYFIK
jgi:uncharacterized protein YhaN